MRWLACLVLLAGCLRARGTVVHPTGPERTSGASGSTIARVAPATEVPERPSDPAANLWSVELGALVPFDDAWHETTRIHIAPGVRMFGSQGVLYGVAVGADILPRRGGPGFAMEGSVHARSSGNDPERIVQAVDLFGGITMHSQHTSIAAGPSVGLLGMPGGRSQVMIGIGLRVTSDPKPAKRRR